MHSSFFPIFLRLPITAVGDVAGAGECYGEADGEWCEMMVLVKVSVMVKVAFDVCRSLVVGDGRCRSRSRLW